MRVLVTGAGGFIGSHLVERLVARGHEVRALDLAWPEPVSEPVSAPARGVEQLTGDVTSEEDCREAARGCDGVCHLAAKVGDWGPAAVYLRVNVEGTRTLLRAARAAGARRFLLVSSVAVHHYRGLRAADEETPRDGRINAYCRSKIAAEDVVTGESGDMEWTIVRPGVFPFGPRDRTSFLPLARELEKGGGGYVRGGRALVTTAYVENLVEGLCVALERPEGAREVFLIGDDAEVSWRELFGRFAEELGVRPPRLSVPLAVAYPFAGAWEGVYKLFGAKRAPLLTRYRVLLAARDCHFVSEKAKRLLGYRPAVDLDEAVRRTVAWYRSL